jgi:hypothetical protein
MRHLGIRATVLLVLLATGFAVTAVAADPPHLRIVDRRLKEQVDRAAQQSETLRELIARIESASALVFVQCDPSLKAALSAHLGLVTRVDQLRFVHIAVRCTLPESQLIPILAHEFHHALEIGERPEIVDTDSMELFYESVGFESGRDGSHRAFETEAARAVQRQVADELRRPASGTINGTRE